MRFRSAAMAVVACCGLSLSVSAAPPTDAEIDGAISAFNTKMQEAMTRGDRGAAAQGKAAAEALGGMSLGEATIDQLEKLQSGRVLSAASMDEGLRVKLSERLTALAKEPGADGARASALSLFVMPRPTGDNDGAVKGARDAVMAALKHPGMPAALSAGKGMDVFRFANMLPEGAFAGAGLASAAQGLLSGDLPPAAIMGMSDLFDVVADESTQTDRVEQDKLRVALLSALDSAAPKVTDERARSRMERTRTYLSGAYAKGTLVNGPAPDLDFTWTTFSGEGAPKRLSDLKGRVVVIDFWATWCGPCVASFPQVRELAARYKDYPVTILGVTSLQGSSTKWENGRPVRPAVDTKGDPAKEHELMGEFVKAMDMTWPVVFSKQEVFNPEYGVKGIPHVVIIDAKGVVRYRGLHPAADPEAKHGKIDALLKEAGLPFPGGGGKSGGEG